MWRQSDVLSGGPIHPRVLALGQSRLLTAMCWDCVRVAGGQPWLSWRAGSASIAGIGTGLGDTLYCRPKFWQCSCAPPFANKRGAGPPCDSTDLGGGYGFQRGKVPLTELVKGNRCLLVEVDRNPDGVDGLCRGYILRSQCSAVIDLGGLSRCAGQRRQPHIFLQNDDILCNPDLPLKAGNFHQVERVGCPVKVLCGVALQMEDVDTHSRWHRLARGRGPISRRGRGIQRCCHRGVAWRDIAAVRRWLEHCGLEGVVEGAELAVGAFGGWGNGLSSTGIGVEARGAGRGG